MIPFNLNPSARMRSALFCWVAGTRTLFLDGVSQGAATSLVVPAGVSEMLLSGSGGGGGGAGGFASAGGGGGGGGAGMSVRDCPIIVVPGSTLNISVGGGGSGGAVGAAGAAGATTNIDGVLHTLVPFPLASGTITPGSTYPQLQLWPGNGGAVGTATNGGNGGGASFGNVAGGTGGAGVGGAGTFAGIDTYFFQGTGGGAGGGVNAAGGPTTTTASGNLVPGAFSGGQAGNATNGGGGNGGTSLFSGFNGHGKGGNAVTPAAATPGVWGGGGGGGSGNNIGREGGDGFVLLRWVSPW